MLTTDMITDMIKRLNQYRCSEENTYVNTFVYTFEEIKDHLENMEFLAKYAKGGLTESDLIQTREAINQIVAFYPPLVREKLREILKGLDMGELEQNERLGVNTIRALGLDTKKKLSIEVEWVRDRGNSDYKYEMHTVGGTYPGICFTSVCLDTEEKAQKAMRQVNEEFGVVEIQNRNNTHELAIRECLEMANGRESEWGDRAVDAFNILYKALGQEEEIADEIDRIGKGN